MSAEPTSASIRTGLSNTDDSRRLIVWLGADFNLQELLISTSTHFTVFDSRCDVLMTDYILLLITFKISF